MIRGVVKSWRILWLISMPIFIQVRFELHIYRAWVHSLVKQLSRKNVAVAQTNIKAD